ncbi:uncharacterized protein LMH87_007623 [Akanthomyces muscarius]|uniref:Uncharacterized protein n=1 Tax=Akanthomyces muscarius TaxID=2231603 RepID=A0A9W8UPZ7_AKAMU|nr:uncharacterized protein LMH87_007623 [Akanthomyces muscarius]KAJ4161592.1 hypothetical protein LMH87_007623 [Akanthomyces muscarius]
MDNLSPPSAQEQDLYYDGLPSHPRLVARSSIEPWQSIHGPDRHPVTNLRRRKAFLPPSRHDVMRLWNVKDAPLRRDIKHQLQHLSWNAIELFRVGFEDEQDPHGWKLTLMVSVMPESATTWSVAAQAAVACKAVLESYNIFDIHCEIRESSILLLASEPADNLKVRGIDHLPSQDPRSLDGHRSPYLGTSIASLSNPAIGATKGLYLRISEHGQEHQATVALTCRHLLETTLSTNVEIRGGPDVIQPCQRTLEAYIANQQDQINYIDSLNSKQRASADYQKMKYDAESRLRAASLLKYPESRKIGRVHYAPPIALRQSSHHDSWLADWLLVQLDPAHQEDALSDLTNDIVLENHSGQKRLQRVLAQMKVQPEAPRFFDNKLYKLQLAGTVTERELRNPPHSELNDDAVLFVGKVGARSGLTFGLGSTMASVVRYPLKGMTLESLEWPVHHVKGDPNFSAPGDSGSIVWTVDGRIVGMVTGGCGVRSMDITYVTPIERLLADVRSRGFNVEII